MTPTVASWVAGAVAAGCGFATWLPWATRTLRHVLFADQVAKLCQSGNVERARKLCAAAPRSPVVGATGACLAALDAGGDEPESETIARLREIYRTEMKERIAVASAGSWLGLVALAAAAIAIYLVAVGSAPPPAVAPAGLAVLLVVAAWRTARRIAVEGAEQGERLLPIMAAARRR